MHRLRLALAALAAAILLPACVTLDGAGQTITQAQQQYLASLQAQADRDAARTESLLDAIGKFADSDNETAQVLALVILERVANPPAAAAATPPPPPQPAGPITTALKTLAPFVLPIAQIWQADRQGERSLTQAVANMDLIGTLAGQIHRDPLVVETPAAQIIHAPAPVIITPPDPIVIEQPAPIVLPPAG